MDSSRHNADAADDADAADASADGSPPSFEAALAEHRRSVLLLGYQLLGSPHDAEDLAQETMLRAWRSRHRFDAAKAPLRAWVHGIAWNAARDALASRQRRPLPSTLVEASDDVGRALVPAFDVPWLLPIATRRFDGPGDPATAAVARGDVTLAFCAALQLLPARQRAALVLCEVLELPAAEAATALDATVPALNSLLQRARRALAAQPAGADRARPPRGDEAAVAERYVEAFARADVDGLRALLAADARLEMPPVPPWYVGRDRYGAFMERVYAMRGTSWRTVATSANGEPASFAAYVADGDGWALHSLQVLTVRQGLVVRNVVYVEPAAFAELGLAPRR